MDFTGAEIGELRRCILPVFTPFSLSAFFKTRLEIDFFNHVTFGAPFDHQIFQIIELAIAEAWIENLLRALLQERPANTCLLSLGLKKNILVDAQKMPIEGNVLSEKLERLINNDPLINPQAFIEGLSRTKRCVCRIMITTRTSRKFGTGFLVGKDMVLSNYHVFKDIIDDPSLAAGTICKFDFELSGNGTVINSGMDVGLSLQDPIIAYSPYCGFDLNGTLSVNVDWPAESFDYALVRLDEAVGDQPFGINAAQAGSEAALRGWIKPPSPELQIEAGDSMLILQHPDKRPLELAIGLKKVLALDDQHRRVRYDINTEGGSSGAPCFDLSFNWTAVHNMGDPNYNASYNQGIPAAQIIADLNTKKIFLS